MVTGIASELVLLVFLICFLSSLSPSPLSSRPPSSPRSCQVVPRLEKDGLEIVSATTMASVNYNPFRIDFLVHNEIAVVLNSKGLMNFEHYRAKKK